MAYRIGYTSEKGVLLEEGRFDLLQTACVLLRTMGDLFEKERDLRLPPGYLNLRGNRIHFANDGLSFFDNDKQEIWRIYQVQDMIVPMGYDGKHTYALSHDLKNIFKVN